jgi:hypothetical protein
LGLKKQKLKRNLKMREGIFVMKILLPMTARKLIVTPILLSLLAYVVFSQQGAATKKTTVGLSAAEKKLASQLKAETVREVTTALVAKEMEGRGTAQSGGDRAAKYLADRFAKIGLKPGGDANTYLQSIKFKIEQVQSDSSFKAGATTFKYREDFLIAPPLPTESQTVNGGLVFVSYGVVSEELKRDDLAGLDVKGKVVMVLDGKPKNVDDKLWAKAANQQVVFGRLIGKGAVGFVVIYQGRATVPFSLAAEYLSRRRVSLADAPSMLLKVPPIALINASAAEKLFAASGQTLAQAKERTDDGAFVSRDLNQQATISARLKREAGTSSNVIGVLEGSDAKLKEQAVVYTAHYDAYGIELDGAIYPGAGDNAIGVAKLVAIAETMAKPATKPRRSIIFIATTAEEAGLLGAEYWVQHPTWPIEKVACNINYDGIGTDAWGKLGNIFDLGFSHSDMGKVMDDVAAATGLTISPEPMKEEGFFYRSDHYAFFKKGVPAVYLVGTPAGDEQALIVRVAKWLMTDYHMATDTIQPNWNWDGARELAALGLISGMRIANQEAMPAWKADSPYNRPRGTSLPPPPRQ